MKTLDAQFWLKISKLTEAHERGDLTGNELRHHIADVGRNYGLTPADMVKRQLLDTTDGFDPAVTGHQQEPGSRKGARKQ